MTEATRNDLLPCERQQHKRRRCERRSSDIQGQARQKLAQGEEVEDGHGIGWYGAPVAA